MVAVKKAMIFKKIITIYKGIVTSVELSVACEILKLHTGKSAVLVGGRP